MVAGSQVSACQVSNWLIAELGVKLQPTSQGCFAYHAFACSTVHWPRGCETSCRIEVQLVRPHSNKAPRIRNVFNFIYDFQTVTRFFQPAESRMQSARDSSIISQAHHHNLRNEDQTANGDQHNFRIQVPIISCSNT